MANRDKRPADWTIKRGGRNKNGWTKRSQPQPEAESGSLVTSMEDVEERKVEWLWPGWLARRKLHILDGDPDLGKSSVVYDLMARFSRGGVLPNGASTVPLKSIIMTSEDGLSDTVKPTLRAAQADMKMIGMLRLRKDDDGNTIPFTVPDDVPQLELALKEFPAAIVVLDPIIGYLSENVQSGNDAQVRRALAPLTELADRHGCVIWGIRHLKKDEREKNPMYRGGGSIAFTAAARVVMLIDKPPNSSEHDPARVMAIVKNNLMRKANVPSLMFEVTEWDEDSDIRVVEWNGESPVTAQEMLKGHDGRRDDFARQEAKLVLRDILSVGPMASKQVNDEAEQAGLALATTRRALKDMGAHKYRLRGDDGRTLGWYTHLPETPCPPECMSSRVIRVSKDDGGDDGGE